ncbi:hypothetical protein [Streptomyces apocyni]|uniref:hypothetical protein n=1 Tax=Streptomyces apocyni TaxID=2654677 RepID=UPI0012EA71C6|nr:hypothetical protein [Streptomyces apocyni]
MSQISRPPSSPAPARLREPSRASQVLLVIAIASCLPYLALKIAWIAGSRIGIPSGSSLLDEGTRVALISVNALTVLMDAAVIVLALVLTQAWGRRTPAPLLVFPMWAATGLLTPIMAGFPVQLAVGIFSGPAEKSSSNGDPFLDDWVFGIVYGGFIVQGLTLGILFVRYARQRWGHVWQGRMGELPRDEGRAARTAAVAGALLALVPIAVHLMWAAGSNSGLPQQRIDERTAEFNALEFLSAATAAVAVAGVLLLVFAPRATTFLRLPVKVPLAVAWAGSGAVGCWGAWMSFAALIPQDDPAKQPPSLMVTTNALSLVAGLLLAYGVASFLRRRTS